MRGAAVDFDECPNQGKRRGCHCGYCALCGKPKHVALHGGVVGKEGVVYDHEYVDRRGHNPIDTTVPK